jgi:hypothetical protein
MGNGKNGFLVFITNFTTLDEFCFTTAERNFWKIADPLFEFHQ